MKDTQVCSVCGNPWTQHPITLEWTCFRHGRPDGSPNELRVWLISQAERGA